MTNKFCEHGGPYWLAVVCEEMDETFFACSKLCAPSAIRIYNAAGHTPILTLCPAENCVVN